MAEGLNHSMVRRRMAESGNRKDNPVDDHWEGFDGDGDDRSRFGGDGSEPNPEAQARWRDEVATRNGWSPVFLTGIGLSPGNRSRAWKRVTVFGWRKVHTFGCEPETG